MTFAPNKTICCVKEEKKGAAKALFIAGFTQAHIAKILDLSANTVGKWSADHKWTEAKNRVNMLEENTITDLMEIFDYQVTCLKIRMEQMRQDGEMKPFAPGEFDALQKLFSTIKPDWQRFRAHVEILKQFMEYVQSQNLELAKSLTDIADMYILEKSKIK